MNKSSESERRRHERYETDLQVQFYVSFDIETKIDFRIKKQGQFLPEKYKAISRNVSVEGVCFLTEKKLKRGDLLALEIYVPSAKNPVPMEGEVRWVLPMREEHHGEEFCVGVQLLTVRGEMVEKSIFIDHVHHVVWSVALESVFGTFKELSTQVKNLKHK